MNVEKKSTLSLFFLVPSLIIGLIAIIISIVCFIVMAKIGLKNAAEFWSVLTQLYYLFFVASILSAISLVIAHYKNSKKTWSVVLLATWLTFAIIFVFISQELRTAPFLYQLF